VAGSPWRLYIHINDNDGRWDWDYFCGTKHFLEYVEFLYYLKKFGYKDYLTSDTSPTRWDVRGTFEATAGSRTASGPCSNASTTRPSRDSFREATT